MKTPKEITQDFTLPQHFEAQVLRTPDKIAVRYDDIELSYKELDHRATQLAHHLQKLKVGPDVLVGIFVHRNPDMLVTLLGILKAGGAYIPLDPDYPHDRLDYMLTHSRAPVVITQQSLLKLLPSCQSEIICIDRDWETITGAIDEDQAACENVGVLTPDNLAYVIYTSGSTGKPKGVQIQHGSVVNFLDSMSNRPGIEQNDVLLAVTTISFDISVLELFLPLVTGASVVIANKETSSDGELLKSALISNDITIMQATPATWRLLIAAGWKGGDDFKVLCGGEALPRDLAAQLSRAAGSVWNMYGPTETTIWSTCYRLTADNGPIYIGQPIAKTQVYLLDAKMNPVPIGVAGELYIGGAGVARGYLHNPELTSKSFLPDPFSNEPGARIYKTGDEVRFLSNGNIEYRKRLDTQVKVRGYRIELGEIETALSCHNAIQQNAVIIRDDGKGEKEIVAYIVTVDGIVISANEMRELLKTSLPDYMIPSRFVLLDELPTTPNGKIDRKAMPDPSLCTMAEEDDYTAPRTALEEKLSSLWSNLLEREKVGINSNFFDLGGHSLLVTRMWAILKKELQIPLTLRDVFDAPTISQLAQVIQSQSGSQEIENQLDDNEETVTIPKRASAGAPLASLAQLRFWFVDQLTSNAALYNLCSAFRLHGDLDISLLQRSLNSIIARQGSMRTSLRWESKNPVQHIVPTLHYELPVVDFSQDEKELREAKLLELVDEQTQQAFDLSASPLFKLILIKMGVAEHVLFFMPHHVIWDGWSFDIFLKELVELYTALKAGREPQLPKLAVQYADFSEWHNSWVESDALNKQLDYWHENLGGDLPVLELPSYKPRPAEMSFNGALLGFSLPEKLVASLNLIANENYATLNMVLLAAFKVLLYRFTGQEDLIVGSPIQGRTIRETQDLIGVFVNTLVLRTRIHHESSFINALSKVRETCLSAYDHQDVPFERLVKELAVEKTLSRTPLFQVMFVFQEISSRAPAMADIEIQQIEIFNNASMTDLILGVEVAGNKLSGSIEYSTDLFDADSIEAFIAYYITLLESIVADPAQRIDDIPILDETQRSQLLLEWNTTAMEYDRDGCLHQLIEAQVDRTPDTVAVCFEEQVLSYQVLEQKANQLAHQLQSLGVGPDVLVGVSLERSEQMLVALLGVLKAGGAYVPMDPDYPQERLAYMLEHAGVPVLLTESALLEHLPEHRAQVVCLDTDWDHIGELSTARPTVAVQPEHLAYLIYTSGSTGKPKGVQVPHGAAVNFLTSMAQEPGLTAQDVLLAVTTLSFDIAVLELYLPLIVGGRVEIASREMAGDGAQLLSKLNEIDASVMQATPATWRLLLSAGWQGDEGFKVLIGGEALPRDLVNELVDRVGGVWNMYGPTETTVWSTCEYVTDKEGPILIGRPIGNTQVYVLDGHRQPVPIGVPGELYIGGAGVTRGYLNAPELTQECFIDDPFGKDPKGRLYRTGDKVHYRWDGRLEYLSRLDNQVKIRGYRIELGEIETNLLTHPAVKQGVVSVREDRPGDVRLVAYVVAVHGESITVTEVRKHLRGSLPEYMIPQHVVELNEMPMTPNGKIDRKALPVPFGVIDLEEESYVAPRTEMEQALAAIWQEVLHVERVGVYDNFFDLGGHSLLSMQVIALIRDRLDKKLTPRTMLLNNLEQIAQRAAMPDGESSNENYMLEIPKRVSKDAPVLSITQQRLWYLDQLDVETLFYNLPIAYRIRGDLDTEALHRSFNEIVQRHEILRTTFQWHGDTPVQEIADSLEIELSIENLCDVAEAQRETQLCQLLQDEADQPFSLSDGALVRLKLFQLEDQEHVLFFMPHHIVFDGWSFGVVLDELSVLYDAYSNAQASPLAPLPIQYADYAVWHRQWLQGEELKRQLDYWLGQLAGELPVLDMPTDHSRPVMQTYKGSGELITFSRSQADVLNKLGHEEKATLYMVFLAAYVALLSRYSGQDEVIIGSPISGRDRPGIDELIGFFVNTLVLRINVDKTQGFRALLKHVRDTCLEAFSHKDTPFEQLVEELDINRDISRNPVYQTLFMFQDVRDRDMTLGGMKLEQVNVHRSGVATDLDLWIEDMHDELIVGLEYNTDLFDADTIKAFLTHYKVLLDSIIANLNQPVAELPIMDKSEYGKLLSDWNATSVGYQSEFCLHQLIEAQVDRTPDSVAVGFEGKALSYKALDKKANQLAHQLLSLGVGPDVLVGVSLERSEQMLIAVLGVLKAGGAYVPMDPDYPQERLGYMLEHAGVPVLLTESALMERLPDHQAQVVCLDRNQDSLNDLSTDRPSVSVRPEHLAYVIYTSGSTGKPKGVQVPHGAVVNFLSSMAQEPGLTAQDVLLAVTTLSFDIAVLELYLPLMVGGRVEIVSRETSSDGDQLLSVLQQNNISVMQATPATWRLLLSAGWQGGNGFKVLVGGEALPRDLMNELVDRVGGVWNMYGPTETTVWSTCEYVTDKAGPILIGRPIGNTQVYVLDEKQQPVPIGIPGELYIGGAGVVRGYLNASELTEKSFIPDRFVKDPQARLYRTGDQVRYRRDGRLEYLSRLDNQVKIRGYRIELGEIETNLLTHPAVKQGVVSVREDRPGDVRLVAYVVAEPGDGITVTEVRKHLRGSLPEYMIPQHVVELNEMPMTPNGKIDRKALPAPFGEIALDEEAYVAPRTKMEQALAAIWQEVLHVERVGVHDNFFDLGGHSLLSMQVIALIRGRLDKRLTPRAMLMNNLEQIAQQCGDILSDGEQKEVAGNEKDSVAVRLFDKIKTKIRM